MLIWKLLIWILQPFVYHFVIGWPLPRRTSWSPFLMWSTTTPFFYRTTRFHYVVGLSSLRRTYVERIFSSKTCRLINNENVVLQLVVHLFVSCSFGTALVVLYSTNNNSIVLKPWSGCVTASLSRRGIWRSTDTPCTMARHGRAMNYGAS